jgi:hypothetical protein
MNNDSLEKRLKEVATRLSESNQTNLKRGRVPSIIVSEDGKKRRLEEKLHQYLHVTKQKVEKLDRSEEIALENIFVVFPIQTDAFAYCDAVNWTHGSDVVKVFSLEVDTGIKRKFIVCKPSRLLSRCMDIPVDACNYYEIIRADTPCHLFFDVEFKRSDEMNVHLDGELLCSIFLFHVSTFLHEKYGFNITWKNVLQLDSSMKTKFSRHFIVHLPSSTTEEGRKVERKFRSVLHVGEFVLQLFEKLEGMKEEDPAIAGLWAESSKKPSGARDHQEEGQEEQVRYEEPIVDLAVYTRNRAMRIYLSTKVGKKTPLYPPKWNLFNIDCEGDTSVHTPSEGLNLSYWVRHSGSKSSSSNSKSSSIGSSSKSSNTSASMKEKGSDLNIEFTELVDPSGGKREIQTGSRAWEKQFMWDSFITGVRSPLWISQRLRRGDGSVKDELGAQSSQSLSRSEYASKFSPFALKEVMKELADEESLHVAGSEFNPATLPGDPTIELLYCWSQNGRPLGSRSRRFNDPNMSSNVVEMNTETVNKLPNLTTTTRPGDFPSFSGPVATSSGYGSRSFPITSLVDWVLSAAAGPDSLPSSQRAHVRSWTLKRKKELNEFDPAGFILATFEIGGSRYCFNVMRHHKGNHVAWHVDFLSKQAWQTCHDIDCKHFRSPVIVVPPACLLNDN